MADDVVIRILIQAVDQASAALAQVGTAATQAAQKAATGFAQLGASSEAAFAKTTTAAKEVGTSFQNLGQTVAGFSAGLAQGIGQGVSEAFPKVSAAAKETTVTIQTLGQAIAGFSSGLVQGIGQGLSQAFTKTGQGASAAASSMESAATSSSHLRTEMSALLSVMTASGAGFGGFGSAISLIASRLGIVGIAALAVGAAFSASVVAAKAASDSVRDLGQVADRTGESFTRLSGVQTALRDLGASGQNVTQSLGGLASKLSQDFASLADEAKRSADTIATAFNKVQLAQISVQSTQLAGQQLQLKAQNLKLDQQSLQNQGQLLVLQVKGIDIQGQQLQNSLAGVKLQLSYFSQLAQIDQKRAALNVGDAEANLQKLELQKQLITGKISQAQYDAKLAVIDKQALDRAIEKAEVDVEAAKTAQEMLPEQQDQQRQALELQKQQIELQQQMLPLQKRALEIEIEKNGLAQKGNTLDQQQNALDIQRNMVEQVQAEIDLRNANRDLIKAQANDLQKLVDGLVAAAKAGGEFKFPDATDFATKVKAVELAAIELGKTFKTQAEAIDALFKSLGTSAGGFADKLDIGKALGLTPDVIRAINEAKGKLGELAEAAIKAGRAFTDEDRTRLDATAAAYDRMAGAAARLKDAFGAFNAENATKFFNSIAIGINNLPSADKINSIADAMNRITGVNDANKGIGSGLLDIITGLPAILNKAIDGVISGLDTISGKIADALKNIFKGLITPANAGELEKGLTAPVEKAADDIKRIDIFSTIVDKAKEAANEIEAIFNNIKPEFSGGLDFSGVVDAARSAANEIEAIFETIKPQFSFDILNSADLIEAAKNALAEIEPMFKDIKLAFGGLDVDALIGDARIASQEIISLFADLVLPSPTMDFTDLLNSARIAAEEIKRIFEGVKPNFSGSLNLDNTVKSITQNAPAIENAVAVPFKAAARDVAASANAMGNSITDVIDKVKTAGGGGEPSQFLTRLVEDWRTTSELCVGYAGTITDAIDKVKTAGGGGGEPSQFLTRLVEDWRTTSELCTGYANTIDKTFTSVTQSIGSSSNQIDSSFDSVDVAVQSNMTAVQQIFRQLGSLGSIDLSGLVASLSSATQAAMELASVSFGGIISQVDSAASAFDSMASSANAAASAAAAAASASSSGAGGNRLGGLFRGRPGTDTNLAWLTDYEFVMRPEAVMRYGVAFMHAINSLQFPSGFRQGGLNLAGMMSGLSFSPRIALPAFAAGGISTAAGSQSSRTLNLTIAGQTFRGLTVPEDVAKSLERAAVANQASSLGLRPRWNK